jgi:polyribonucleotide nucleotidyltransferase
MNKTYQIEIGGKPLKVIIRNLAEQANGEVLVSYGETTILATAVMSFEEKNLDFFPLTVNYEERYYAAGRIGGSRYIRREGKPSEMAVLKSRIIDRSIRPYFPANFKNEVQVIITCLSWDGENDPDFISIIGASLALSVSDIPFNGPIASLRVIFKNNKFLINPSYQEREEAELDIIFAGKEENGEILIDMIEAEGLEAQEELIVEAYEAIKEDFKKILDFQKEIQKELGKKKLVVFEKQTKELEEKIKSNFALEIERYLYQMNARDEKKFFLEELKTKIKELGFEDEALFFELLRNEVKKVFRKNILEKEKRPDGRKLDELREIKGEAGILPRTHGSGLFIRGNTKSLSILTLGAPGDQRLLEEMEFVGKKRFMHHYNFPPYSTGEVKPITGPGRREIGHGMLVEKALLPMIPEFEKFPYTIRVVSEVLSSNGSTSMASVCSSSLALMDGGVPIKKIVAGIALGLIKEGKDYKILTDIQGPEDHFGDMDFKIAGTKEGITAIQLDTKISGINKEILKESLLKAKEARLKIIEKLEAVLSAPRKEISPFAPKIFTLNINPEKIGELIGPKGKTIKEIIEKTGVAIDIEPSGTVYITTEKEDSAETAMVLISRITKELKVGEIFSGRVKRMIRSGAIVELEGGQKGLLPRSKLPQSIKIGDIIEVRVISNNKEGKPLFSLKQSYQKHDRRS